MIKFSTYAKCVLCGEHAVIRGGKAIAFPVRRYLCSIRYAECTDAGLSSLVKYNGKDCRNIIWRLIKTAFEIVNIHEITGNFIIENDIPIAAGLGSSAAICVNIAKIFKHLDFYHDVT
ncbi:MAG: hypothetical protein LBJ19_00070, partial [Holosporaceae bacterium]|nr:hypothetical protein [Holosporaceae bacterium]